jgi:retron-type reverse transcriptase
MQTYRNLFTKLCEHDNLLLAFNKARARKNGKEYVQRFAKNLKEELCALQWELSTGIYRPGPLKTFTVRDPKTRKISASRFRDRVVHHAICNIIEPIFEPRFIYDCMANRKGKGTSRTLERADQAIRKVGNGYALKADIRRYFDTVDHEVLLRILEKRIKDAELLDLVKVILGNHKTGQPGKGMPLGNLTSQFFANVYLAELDHYVKHELRTRHYIRYVDDFVIFSKSREELEGWQNAIDTYLTHQLKLSLHPEKTKIIPIAAGVPLVGFRVFRHHKLLKKSNLRRLRGRLDRFRRMLTAGELTKEQLQHSMAGWEGYAKMGNTFNLRQKIRGEIANIGGTT